ncbi:hypothetical protein R1flu_009645 [Riccia fluitans]|uniref:Uncharacterized protein n=1 Tax=Riccia fluitans TaxID=41844 RepID=A0ABD1Z2Q4_9MARC
MGLFFIIPLLTFVGWKVSRHLFLFTVQSFVAFFTTFFWIGRARPTSTSISSSSEMPTSGGSAPSSPSASRSLVQYLNQILSMRGPNQLPYEEDVKWAIRQNLLALAKEYAGLQVQTAPFTHNDGRSTTLLQIFGTIPMYYRDVKYNIPVEMWLLESFPRVAPMAIVTPTQEMIIKPQHRFVDASGIVTVPYLQQWIYPRSNLVDLAQNMSEIFGQDPPLYSRQSAVPSHLQRVQTGAHSPRTSSIHGTNPMYSSSSIGPGSPRPQSPYSAPNRLHSLNPPYTVSPSASPRPPAPAPAPAVRTENPVEVFRSKAISALSERLDHDINVISKRGGSEMDDLFNTQVLLNERSARADQGIHEMKREKEALEEELQLYMTNTMEIESWLRQNDGGGGRSQFDIDHAFEPTDSLSNQLLENTAADLAIEDLLYSLDRAVQDGVVPWDSYYKAVRTLSREQFYIRATCAKVLAAQRHFQVESMALRASSMSVS